LSSTSIKDQHMTKTRCSVKRIVKGPGILDMWAAAKEQTGRPHEKRKRGPNKFDYSGQLGDKKCRIDCA
jgi:hypothetical protein